MISKGSFPSGHANNAFMVAAFFGACIKRKRSVFYGVAGLVSLSRVYLGVHFPSDVLMGALLGWGITQLILSSHGNLDSEEDKLPDDERRFKEGELRWVAGGMDGAFGHHAGAHNNEEIADKIACSN